MTAVVQFDVVPLSVVRQDRSKGTARNGERRPRADEGVSGQFSHGGVLALVECRRVFVVFVPLEVTRETDDVVSTRSGPVVVLRFGDNDRGPTVSVCERVLIEFDYVLRMERSYENRTVNYWDGRSSSGIWMSSGLSASTSDGAVSSSLMSAATANCSEVSTMPWISSRRSAFTR